MELILYPHNNHLTQVVHITSEPTFSLLTTDSILFFFEKGGLPGLCIRTMHTDSILLMQKLFHHENELICSTERAIKFMYITTRHKELT